MAIKLIFALFGLLCLLAGYQAASTSSSQESSEEISMKEFVERLKLVALTLEEFASYYTEVADKGPKIFVGVLKDPKVLEVKTETMERQTKILQNYLDKFEESNKGENKAHIFELVEEFSEIIDRFDGKKHALSAEATIIEKSLQEHGLVDFEKSIHQHFEKFLVKFSAEVEPYLKGLNEKEKEDEKEFIDWYQKLKSEKDIDKKIEMFDNFIEVEDD